MSSKGSTDDQATITAVIRKLLNDSDCVFLGDIESDCSALGVDTRGGWAIAADKYLTRNIVQWLGSEDLAVVIARIHADNEMTIHLGTDLTGFALTGMLTLPLVDYDDSGPEDFQYPDEDMRWLPSVLSRPGVPEL